MTRINRDRIFEVYTYPNTGLSKRTSLVRTGKVIPSNPPTSKKKQYVFKAIFYDGQEVYGTSLDMSAYPATYTDTARNDAYRNLMKRISAQYSYIYGEQEGIDIFKNADLNKNVVLFEGWIAYDSRNSRN
jgi:hypothetical protein